MTAQQYREFFRTAWERTKRSHADYPLPSGAVLTAQRGTRGITRFLLDRNHAGELWGGQFFMTDALTDDQHLMLQTLAFAGADAVRKNHPRAALDAGVGQEFASIPCPREHEDWVYRAIGGIELSMWSSAVHYVSENFDRANPNYPLPERFWELAWYYGHTPDGSPRSGECPAGSDRLYTLTRRYPFPRLTA
jgi:hypothetical protein